MYIHVNYILYIIEVNLANDGGNMNHSIESS